MTDPFQLNLKSPLLARFISRSLGFDVMSRIYREKPPGTDTRGFLQYVLDSLGVSLQVNHRDRLETIPSEGPLLIVANHPLGGLEGVAIARLLMEVRSDLRVLTNQLLRRIPELAEIFIGVDVLSKDAARQNIAGIKQAHSHLKKGGALLIFPAGVVSRYRLKEGVIADQPWDRLVGQLIRRHHCPCVPFHVGGRNSLTFYVAGLMHRRLGTVMLPRQLLNKRGCCLPLTPGNTIPHAELASFNDPRAITEYLRISTEALAPADGGHELSAQQGGKEFATDVQQDKLQAAIDALQDCRLVEHKDFDVYCAPHERLGVVMEQIAISREVTFRMVGEGTGLEMDSDRFDPSYLHLFLWDRDARKVAGAYRIGLVDRIVQRHGVKGLYTRSLYRYNKAFLDRLGAAVEMGRSFVHPDYQRRPVALNLLWRGIGAFINENPGYHTLFGSVSISREYTDLARALIADTLLTNFQADDFQDLVKPITPHKINYRVWSIETLKELANIKILSKLVGRCDPGKAVPVLLRHYLSLNGRLVCFNVHPHFNNSLEGLIIVDMRLCDSKTAIRFIGEEGYNRFLEIHRLEKSA
jgi:putative hemolysin